MNFSSNMQAFALIGAVCLFLEVGGTTLPSLNAIKLSNAVEKQTNSVYTCDASNSKNYFIYCSGELLKAVNIHRIYNDSKTFVDMPMKQDPVITLQQFNSRFPNVTAEQIKRNDLIAFLDEFFLPPGTELQECILSDWTPNPPLLMKIADPVLRKFALDLNDVWKVLCRRAKPELTNWDRHSLIYVPNEFVVPGGRFREFYYWDAYWIIKGLLACGMHTTTKAMINNLASMVQTYGFVPNGGRVYYLQRSQPPFLCGMAYEYFERTRDYDFLLNILPVLAKEFSFWKNNRTIAVTGLNNQTYSVFLYRTNSNVPRPESYREDFIAASALPDDAKPLFYRNVASAAESGWDFSTRWFADKKSFEKIQTTSIAPIDLNAIMCWNMDILEYLFKMAGDFTESRKYRDMRGEFLYALQYVFYNISVGAWFDYNVETRMHNVEFYPSIAVPLFGDCYQLLNMAKPQRIYDFMDASGVFEYPGGVPTSLAKDSHQQWDFPNGWSPLNHMIVEGLRKSGNPEMQEQAYRIARKWVLGNFKVFNTTGHMWEKYDVIGTIPQPGAGGEYAVQPGFGWSNGAILDLLVTYYDRLSLPSTTTSSPGTTGTPELTTSDCSFSFPSETSFLISTVITIAIFTGAI